MGGPSTGGVSVKGVSVAGVSVLGVSVLGVSVRAVTGVLSVLEPRGEGESHRASDGSRVEAAVGSDGSRVASSRCAERRGDLSVALSLLLARLPKVPLAKLALAKLALPTPLPPKLALPKLALPKLALPKLALLSPPLSGFRAERRRGVLRSSNERWSACSL